MSSNPDRHCYNVYFPSDIRASFYPVEVSSDALLRVRQLVQAIRDDSELQKLLQNEPFTLHKFTKKYEGSPEEFYRGVVEWLHSDPAGREQMHPGSLLRKFFPDGPASVKEERIDVVIATDSVMESRDSDLEHFLQTTTLPLRPIIETSSNKTHPYDTTQVFLYEDESPFIAIKFLPDHPVVDREGLFRANGLVSNYAKTIARDPLAHEPSVWVGTHNILYTCVACLDAVGSKFLVRTEILSARANVKMDSIVHLENSNESENVRTDSVDNSTSIQNGSGLAVEDKSPKVFRTHCTDNNIDALCQNEVLRLQGTEYGFRAIFFKLMIFMIQKRLHWGLLNCGSHMRIVRIKFKGRRPYAIISEEIRADTPPPSSVYSLICYMLLTCDGEVPIFNGLKDSVPAPPPIAKNRDRKRIDLAPLGPLGDVTSMVLHTTAAAGRILIDIPMTRIDKPQTVLNDIRSAHVHVVDFLGAGTFGRIFLAELFVDDLYYGKFVVKFANTHLEEYLNVEARAYIKLRSLYGNGIPRYYGLFSGENTGIRYWCILMDFCGDPVKRTDILSPAQRFEIFRILLMIHQQGVMHNDFSPMNILWSKSGVQLIDFSVAIIEHECAGLESCPELISSATELRLTPLHMRFVSLWSFGLDVYRFIMHTQFRLVIDFVLFVFIMLFLCLTTFSIKQA
ncbi:hypothetical protein A7U60_g5678 [Sanghuangporus baumii]|uniref:Protein kinase domain-containing protein n=1 Tax=Sanghuangporus baumii TaxID=108892 RepID=A0A9Q5HW94_SANBA|nr:hypothetical protein A7U60_g5678 [Sanghuangporus baumii]